MMVGPKPWLAVVAPARADSRCVKAVDGSAIRNRKSHVDASNGRRFQIDPEEKILRLLNTDVRCRSLSGLCHRKPLIARDR
jgi:hypothetical protein